MSNYLSCIKGEIINYNSCNYNLKKQMYNQLFNKFPTFIIYPINNNDIIWALKYCINNNIKFRIRSGGHSYEAFSSVNNGVIIDVSRLNDIKISNNSLIIGSGVKNRELYDYVTDLGYPFPSGDCPTVGASGFTLGGGWGYSSRYFGLGIDNLKEIEMIDYKGELLIANEQTNEDLFWALRGSGQNNFGIVTKLSYNLPPKIKDSIFLEINIDKINLKEQIEIFNVWQTILENMDNKLTLSCNFIKKNNNVKVIITGIYYGVVNDLYDILKPFKELDKIEIIVRKQTFKETINGIMNSIPSYEKMKKFGLFINNNLTNNDINKTLKHFNNNPCNLESNLILYSFGGKIKEKKEDETSFCHRDALYVISLKTVWESDLFNESNLSYINQGYLLLKDMTSGAFINNPYSELDNYMESYYGKNVPRLLLIKEKYDPNNYFNYEQSIK